MQDLSTSNAVTNEVQAMHGSATVVCNFGAFPVGDMYEASSPHTAVDFSDEGSG